MLQHVFRRISGSRKERASPPASPVPNSASPQMGALPSDLETALHHVSRKVQSKSLHLTFIVIGGLHSSSRQPLEIDIVPVETMDIKTHRFLEDVIRKAERRFPCLCMVRLQTPSQLTLSPDYLIRRSLLQKQVLFSSEGLVLIEVDHLFTLKLQLHEYIRHGLSPARDTCVETLRRLMKMYDHKPLTMRYVLRAYNDLEATESDLRHINSAYLTKYQSVAILAPPTNGSSYLSPTRDDVSVLRYPNRGGGRRQHEAGPKTPLTATDITPITGNEWSMFMMGRS
ncbi:MAG: putative metallocarboxypeptidase ecm14 [Chaenotheca gracillima]|nr:MAG: putative metallocarboxypeptidase ecm14 [Chaenotheca gracillima]